MLSNGSIFASHRAASTPNSSSSPNGVGSTQPKVAPENLTATAAEKSAPNSSSAQLAAEPATLVAKLVVGPGVKLKGAEIQDCDTLLVEGRVEATMDSRNIQIADQGSFDGKVNVDVAEIHGRFNGELTARQQLVIHSTGRVNGKIRYGKIVIHEGGELSGDVKSANAAEATGAEASTTFAITRPLVKTA
ncbi:MAG: polymer-forming cytoskeletal protein [Gammaproteobacteria bacterium]|nr:polymer-forming cytoskeletal protein [Rhodocyclaceae bacterium]MBU3909230.1 polymer-forming cytoskeletal protein [Gammaproteobacteria bacterium]MBU3989662.1 polymer-forming cytoskeletal protein [Gammaproteobacteria bacterium]MBU4005610.1 polymer-forming cytoskeletal protein [Gammaproteobacteria bacterium]MBU4020837.1 polymer-forming cytoskeletal protein [Gammaproteobacteria bacterium]